MQGVEQNSPTRLLTIEDIRREFRIGRDTAYSLAKQVPHIRAGKRFLFRRPDVEEFLMRAASERRDLRTALRTKAKKNGKAPKGVTMQ